MMPKQENWQEALCSSILFKDGEWHLSRRARPLCAQHRVLGKLCSATKSESAPSDGAPHSRYTTVSDSGTSGVGV